MFSNLIIGSFLAVILIIVNEAIIRQLIKATFNFFLNLRFIAIIQIVSSDIPVGTPKILWLASRKSMAKTIIPELEVGNGHPLAVGLHLRQHGLKVCVKAEARSDSPEGLGLDTRFGHAIVF